MLESDSKSTAPQYVEILLLIFLLVLSHPPLVNGGNGCLLERSRSTSRPLIFLLVFWATRSGNKAKGRYCYIK